MKDIDFKTGNFVSVSIENSEILMIVVSPKTNKAVAEIEVVFAEGPLEDYGGGAAGVVIVILLMLCGCCCCCGVPIAIIVGIYICQKR